jgi:hypothetical protein
MKKVIPIVFFLIGVLNYIPIFYFPSFLNKVYYTYNLGIIFITFSGLTFSVFMTEKKRVSVVLLILFVAVVTFSKQIRVVNNSFIVWVNQDTEEVICPFLGYQLVDNTQKGWYDFNYDYLLKYNNNFMTYEALVYHRNHSLDMESFEGDASLVKVYNDDWWQFLKHD